MGKRRAAVLIAVYVLMIAHFAHWRLAGRTVTPIEPSEAMDTLRTGAINAGAIFFAAALLATLVFGRFVCGWGCHIVALQDLCGWLLKKAGLRPRPFRSRLLVFVPLIAALYMFVWPTAVRWWYGLPRPATTWHLTTSDYWATFPGPVIGALTFLVCGLAIVWFLGNKGFCTYACPYGGFFGVLDKLAPMRVRVTDACNQCGHCSAVCTSNVRVAEEVKLFRMVVDPGCMKCMDCVSVCPNDALYVGWGRPAVARGNPSMTLPSREKTGVRVESLARREFRKPLRYDGTWPEEIAMAAIFVVALFCWRGLYGQIPFLFALGLSAITTFVFLKAWQLLTRENLTLHTIVLKRGGRLMRGGYAYGLLAFLLAAFVAHSGLVQYHTWRGDRAFASVTPAITGWPMADSLDPAILPPERESIHRAQAHLGWVDRWGLLRTEPVNVSLAWLDVLVGRPADAERRLRSVAAANPRNPTAHVALGEVLLKQGRTAEAEAEFRRALELDPGDSKAAADLGLLLLRRGDAAGAVEMLGRAGDGAAHGPMPHDEADVLTGYYHAEALRRAGRVDESLAVELRPHGDPRIALAAIARAVQLDPTSAMLRRAEAIERARAGDTEGAARAIARASELDVSDFNTLMHRGRLALGRDDAAEAVRAFGEAERLAPQSWQVQAHLSAALTMAGRFDEAVQRGRRAAAMKPDSADVRATLGAALVSRGDVAGALAEYRETARLDPGNWEYRWRLGFLLAQSGHLEEARSTLREVAACPDPEARAAATRLLAELEKGRPK